MKSLLKKPCDECPWRRKHAAGWLGGYKPEEYTQQIQFDGPPVPCHKTIKQGKEATSICYGSLVFMKNNCKSVRHEEYPPDVLKAVEKDIENVFQWSQEFLDHHKDPDKWVVEANERAKRARS